MTIVWKKIDHVLGLGLRWGSCTLLVVIFILMIGNALVRFVPVVSFGWFDEIIEMLVAWFIFLGAAALWRENQHFTVAFLPDWLKGSKAGHALGIVIDLISLSFILVFTYYSWNLTMRAVSVTPILMMPKGAMYICMPVSGALMIIYSARNIIGNFVRLFEKPSDVRGGAAQATQP
jgi:TRAP-type C4-dicarboxylate transport system permease small subunit